MPQRYIYSKRHRRWLDSHQRRAIRLLVKIARGDGPILISGGFPSGFDNDRAAWLDFRRAEAYKWFLRGSFTAYRYY